MDFLFTKKAQIWINIDIPTKKFTIHHKCIYTDKMSETSYKGIGTLKRDGGWLKADTVKQLKIYLRKGMPSLNL
ncbi:hypothetical protein [Neobacillus sp.]|uniref:hypothetical protein n=1 Tax=Neobacillus sp. TaxID=2675273 RepID=UPI0028982E12|nr:hypothetical protein [Neobacillus sp.]